MSEWALAWAWEWALTSAYKENSHLQKKQKCYQLMGATMDTRSQPAPAADPVHMFLPQGAGSETCGVAHADVLMILLIIQ